jgi:hypothetical protein
MITIFKSRIIKIYNKTPTNVFLKRPKPYITVNPQTKEIVVIPNIELNDFYTSLDLKVATYGIYKRHSI